MSYGVSNMLAPVVVTSVVIGGGLAGWVLLGAVLAVVGFAMGPVGEWAQAHRPAQVAVVQG